PSVLTALGAPRDLHSFPTRRSSDLEELQQRLITLIDTEGIDIVAGMWADSPATTLPGILWRLYLLREWTKQDSELLSTHFRLGRSEEHTSELQYVANSSAVFHFQKK